MESIKKVSYPCRIHGTVYLEDHPRTSEWLITKKYLVLDRGSHLPFFHHTKKELVENEDQSPWICLLVLGKSKHIFSQMVDVHGDESHGRKSGKNKKTDTDTQDSKELPSGKLTYRSWNIPILHRKYIDSI